MTLKQQTWERIDALQETGLTADQRASGLKALAEETDRQLLAKLGPEVLEKYKKSGAGWLSRLQPMPSRP
jgi:hypothetical protein